MYEGWLFVSFIECSLYVSLISSLLIFFFAGLQLAKLSTVSSGVNLMPGRLATRTSEIDSQYRPGF